jgi:hypothetical protein
MKKRIVVLDTSMFLVHLGIPEYDRCGPETDCWNAARIGSHLESRTKEGALLVLPIAVIIETANHIANSSGDRYQLASAFANRIAETIEGRSPWVAFSEQASLWEPAALKEIIAAWPEKAARRISLADCTISKAANFFSDLGHPVEILTADAGLKSLEPSVRGDSRRRRQVRELP